MPLDSASRGGTSSVVRAADPARVLAGFNFSDEFHQSRWANSRAQGKDVTPSAWDALPAVFRLRATPRVAGDDVNGFLTRTDPPRGRRPDAPTLALWHAPLRARSRNAQSRFRRTYAGYLLRRHRCPTQDAYFVDVRRHPARCGIVTMGESGRPPNRPLETIADS